MKKLCYLFVLALAFISCSDNIEPWEKEPLNLDLKFVVETSKSHNSIITTKINDGSIGEVNFELVEEKADNLPYNKTHFNQKVNYYTVSAFYYKDRTMSKTITEANDFEAYEVTLKMFVDGALKKEVTKLINKSDDEVSLDFEFKEYFE